jgi:hypothetical protein
MGPLTTAAQTACSIGPAVVVGIYNFYVLVAVHHTTRSLRGLPRTRVWHTIVHGTIMVPLVPWYHWYHGTRVPYPGTMLLPYQVGTGRTRTTARGTLASTMVVYVYHGTPCTYVLFFGCVLHGQAGCKRHLSCTTRCCRAVSHPKRASW